MKRSFDLECVKRVEKDHWYFDACVRHSSMSSAGFVLGDGTNFLSGCCYSVLTSCYFVPLNRFVEVTGSSPLSVIVARMRAQR